MTSQDALQSMKVETERTRLRLEARHAPLKAVVEQRPVAIAIAERFDVVSSDISRPGEDGYSLLRRVRPGQRNRAIPAAALTANARVEDRERALGAGFQAHIPEPVELALAIARLAGRA